jgi:hypothetical protein
LYTHYATTGNIAAQIACFLYFYITSKNDKKFYLRATLVLLFSPALFIPWLPGYFNAIKSASAEFGPPHIAIDKILNVITLIPGTFSHNPTVLVIYVLLVSASMFLVDKKIVLITLAWGLTPGLLIAVNGHPLYIRHLVTLNTSLLLLSAFSVPRLANLLGRKILKPASNYPNMGLVLGFVLAFSIGLVTGSDKERFYAAETAPYKWQILDVLLDLPKTDLFFTPAYDTYTNTILRWYLGDVTTGFYSSTHNSNKNVLLFTQNKGQNDVKNPIFKRMPELAGMPGFLVSGLQLKKGSPLVFDSNNTLKKYAYSLSDYTILKEAFSWKNIIVDTDKRTLEPANRLEDAEIIFSFHIPTKINAKLTTSLQGIEESGTQDTVALFVSPDNTHYVPLSATTTRDANAQSFSSDYTSESNGNESIYVKLLFKPGMTVPSAVIKSLSFLCDAGQATPGPLSDNPAQPPRALAATAALPTLADFGQGGDANARHLLQSPTEIREVIAPHFDEHFDMDRDLFSKSNLRIKSNEGCLTCSSEAPCQLTYELHSPTKFQSIHTIFYPRIYNDMKKSNHVKVSYSYDDKTYQTLWSTKNNQSLTWHGQREKLSIPLRNNTKKILLRFELYSEGSQIQSVGNHNMYIIAESFPENDQKTDDSQTSYTKTIKRLLGL